MTWIQLIDKHAEGVGGLVILLVLVAGIAICAWAQAFTYRGKR